MTSSILSILIEKMGVADRISSPLTGEEISPLVTHIGAYGIPYDPMAAQAVPFAFRLRMTLGGGGS